MIVSLTHFFRNAFDCFPHNLQLSKHPILDKESFIEGIFINALHINLNTEHGIHNVVQVNRVIALRK